MTCEHDVPEYLGCKECHSNDAAYDEYDAWRELQNDIRDGLV